MQIKRDVEIRFIDFLPQFSKEMVEIGNERFGNNYTNENKLRKYAEKENNICKLAIDIKNEKLLGFFLMHGTDISGLAKEFKLTAEEIKNFIGNNEKICVAKSLVLQKNSEKGGIATELVREGIEKAKKMGFYSSWSPLWIRKDGSIPAKKVIERNGFLFYKNAHMLWVDDEDYRCVDCNGPCKCDAAIYYKIL